jgi:hypothetical protein
MKLDTVWTRSKKISHERLEICRECPSYNSSIDQCKECGCFMKVKTMFVDSVCPINKWGKYKEEITTE